MFKLNAIVFVSIENTISERQLNLLRNRPHRAIFEKDLVVE